jgi:hypothetical protein
MPTEVFDQWIKPNIADYGWPFSPSRLSVAGTRWDKFFLNRPITYWAALHWRLSEFAVRENLLNSYSRSRLHWIIGAVVFGQNTPTARIENTRERFRACAAFSRIKGTIPGPIIGVAELGGFNVVDGHHRLAAIVHLKMANGRSVPAWIGSVAKF